MTDPNPDPQASPPDRRPDRRADDLGRRAGRSREPSSELVPSGDRRAAGPARLLRLAPTPCAASTSHFAADKVTAIIGPSGCGKSTMVRCINRMHEEIDGARAEGQVLLDGLDLYDSRIDIVAVRRAVGMVFQKPNPVPDDVGLRQRRLRACG